METRPYQQSMSAELERAKSFIRLKKLKFVEFIQMRINKRHWFCVILKAPNGDIYSINSGTKKWKVRKSLKTARLKEEGC